MRCPFYDVDVKCVQVATIFGYREFRCSVALLNNCHYYACNHYGRHSFVHETSDLSENEKEEIYNIQKRLRSSIVINRFERKRLIRVNIE